MSAWRESSIADLCLRTVSGGTPSRAVPSYFCDRSEGIPWVRSQELRNRVISTAGQHITEAALSASSAKMVPRGAVLVAMYGATVGQLGYLQVEAATNQAICALITDSDVTDSTFLYYALMHTREDLIRHAHGAAQQNLSQERIRAFRLNIPAVRVQRRIAAFLRAIDDLIENNRRRIELLEQMAQEIYREWFVRFRYLGYEGLGLVDSPLGLIPEGWEVRPFSELASFVNGFAFKPSHWGMSGRPIVKIKELKEGVTSNTPRCSAGAVEEKYWIQPGDLLFSWSADLAVYRWFDEPGLLNQHLFNVLPSCGLPLAFLFHALDVAMPQFRNRAQGTTMRHIKRSALSEVCSVVPGENLLSGFNSAVEPMDQAVLALRRSNQALAAMRDLLLPRLVTGQIDVSKLDFDGLVESVA